MSLLFGIMRTVVLSVLTAVFLLVASLILFGLIAGPVLREPPRKVYTGTQTALRALKDAAVAYQEENGEWPQDDGESTFLYKLMGGGKRPPFLVYRPYCGICGTCQVYNMTSPGHSPWAAGPKGMHADAPLYVPRSSISWPEEYACNVTPFGGTSSGRSPPWDEVRDDPATFPWLAPDVVGYGMQGGQYRYRFGLLGYTVYADGADGEDDGGRRDDVHSYLTPGMLAAYHRAYFVVLLAILALAAYFFLRLVVQRLWIIPISAWLEARR
ncbi:MAG: hypothetical protein AMK73_00700 [Planctomycetes bacterium SM23_32]|nr:MAG: hypothetical protein AMK73_00700 [Planctomycetes bacterium SM23_32]